MLRGARLEQRPRNGSPGVATALGGSLAIGLFLLGQSPQPEAIKSAIEALGDENFERRQGAESRLKEMGASAIPALKAAREHADLEVRKRASELLSVIEHSIRLAPRMVDIKDGQVPLKDLIKDFAGQTGYGIETWPNLQDKPVQLPRGRVPLLQALDMAGRQAGCVVQQGFGDDRIRLGQGQPPEHAWYDGPFRVTATNVQNFRNIDLNQGAGATNRRTDSLTLGLNINAEPRLPLLGVAEPRLSMAIDNLDQSLMGPLPGEPGWNGGAVRHVSRYGNGYRSQSQGFTATMRRASERSTHIKLVRGSVSCVLLVEQKPVPLTTEILKAKGQTATVGTTTFTIEDAQETPAKLVTVKLAVREGKDGATSGDYTWLNSLYQRIELQDAQGRKFMNQGSSWGNSGPNFAQLTFTFAVPPAGANPQPRAPAIPGMAPPPGKVGPPAKLVYTVWETTEHSVPFEFRDLPLP